MGRASKKLHAKLFMDGISDLPTGKMPPHPKMPDMETWIKQGMDPVHVAYAFVQNITSFFAEGASQLPEMKEFAQIVGKAEDDYLPSGPPMSPLTTSFFTTWAVLRPAIRRRRHVVLVLDRVERRGEHEPGPT